MTFVLPLHSLPRFKMLNLLFLFLFLNRLVRPKDELLTSQLIDHLMGGRVLSMPKVLKCFLHWDS